MESVNKLLEDYLKKKPMQELTFGDLGRFGSSMMFIHLKNEGQLKVMRDEINDLLKKEGIALADERFTPHVSLFRMFDFPEDPDGLDNQVKREDIPAVENSPVSKIVFKELARRYRR